MKALKRTLPILLVWTFGITAGAISPIWNGAEELDNGWFYLDWFGSFNEIEPGWIYHSEHGFLRIEGTDPSDFVYYDMALESWFVTGKDNYPILYKMGYLEGWYWYEPGGEPGSRNFHDLASQAVVRELDFIEVVQPTYALIGHGAFNMGSSINVTSQDGRDRATVHEVTLSAYYIQHTQVTNAQFTQVMNWAYSQGLISISENKVWTTEGDVRELYHLPELPVLPSQMNWDGISFSVVTGKGSYPIVGVSWYGAMAYCNFLSRMEGTLSQAVDLSDWSMDLTQTGYRLPTEAEWERACRGGRVDDFRFPWENWWITHENANYYATPVGFSYDQSLTYREHPDWITDTKPYTSPVGSFPPNEYGLYDMAGNAFDWCYDWYEEFYYVNSPDANPLGPDMGTYRVLRGGSWDLNGKWCRVFYRYYEIPRQLSLIRNGFRAVRTAGE